MLNEFIYDPYKGGFLPPKTKNAGRLFVGHQKLALAAGAPHPREANLSLEAEPERKGVE